MNRPLLVEIAKWIISGILISAVMRWAAKSRQKTRKMSEDRLLAHPSSTLIIGLVTFILFGGVAIISNVYDATTSWWVTTILVGFALLSVPMIADYFFCRHEVSDVGLSYGHMTGTRGYLLWSQVSRVHYSKLMKWFRIETRSGEVARISAMLIGLPVFARLLLANTQPDAMDSETLRILKETAEGKTPSVY